MEDVAAIQAGTLVHATDGVVGIVDHVQGDAGRDGMLLIRGSEPDCYYRAPISLVRRVRQDGGAQIAMLDADMAALARYATHAPDAPDRASALSGETQRIPVFEEELFARTQPAAGSVRLHQGVESHVERLTVPVEREEVVIEHLRPDEYDPAAPGDPDVTVIPIVAEEIVVTKRAVVREYLRVRKTRVTEQREIQDTVRRTVVEVEDSTTKGADIKQ